MSKEKLEKLLNFKEKLLKESEIALKESRKDISFEKLFTILDQCLADVKIKGAEKLVVHALWDKFDEKTVKIYIGELSVWKKSKHLSDFYSDKTSKIIGEICEEMGIDSVQESVFEFNKQNENTPQSAIDKLAKLGCTVDPKFSKFIED